ncbi:MAG: LysR family transcriptional regulator [Burkholderiales bacterium]|nr:LysR family transcriptional regulator [Burkholderiales bacterium]MCE7876398.1 LysR family transcriptional regulator [Betaproteobacteria bacterium PRO3]
MPPLKALLAFEAASRHGSFAQGATELAVTPSAISHHIQQLESFLGVRLFDRHAGRATLTGAGRTYAREIESAFGLISDATRLVAPQSQDGILAIAASPSFAAKWLRPRLPEFLREHPGTRVRLSTLSDHRDLDNTRFDIAISYSRPPLLDRDVEPLVVERLRPLCSPALAKVLALNAPADLVRATLIHSANALTWKDYLRQVGSPMLRPAHELWLDRSTMAIDAAAEGLGVVLESELLADIELARGSLVAPFAPEFSVVTTSYYLVRSDSGRNGAATSQFVRWLRQAIGDGRPGAKP